MPDQEQNFEASRHIIIYMDLIFQRTKFVNPLCDVRQSKVQSTVHFVIRTNNILAIKTLISQIAVTNYWNMFYHVLVSKSFNKHFYLSLRLATFLPTFQKRPLPITPYSAATSLTYLHCV
jgi:hypothetical protein